MRDCSLGDAGPGRARCNRPSQERAIETNIDHGTYPFEVLGCDERFLALRLDLGADVCPPEATERQRRRCANEKTAYFRERGGSWEVITYEDETRCSTVRALEPSFPVRFCRPG